MSEICFLSSVFCRLFSDVCCILYEPLGKKSGEFLKNLIEKCLKCRAAAGSAPTRAKFVYSSLNSQSLRDKFPILHSTVLPHQKAFFQFFFA